MTAKRTRTKKQIDRKAKVLKTVKVSNLVEALNAEKARDQIVALRSEIQVAVSEATSVSMLSLLLFIAAPSVFPELINPYLESSLQIMRAFVVVPLAFWLITVFANMVRYFKILKLQDSN